MTVEILLTRGLTTVVDHVDADLAEFKWYVRHNGGGNPYAARKRSKAQPGTGTLWMARVILQRKVGRDLRPGEYVDHANRDSLDNRRANLRVCTYSQNAHNSKKRPGKRGQVPTSPYRGVHWHRGRQTWVASITRKGVRYHLGVFGNERAAAKAYDRKALELFGNFANPNFSVIR